MGDMNCNVDSLRNKVNPLLDKSRDEIALASNHLSSISIPTDFTYKREIINVISKNSEISGNIRKIKEWISSAATKFEEVEGKNKNVLERLFSNFLGMESNSGKNKQQTKKEQKENNWDKLCDYGKDCIDGLKETGAKIEDAFTNWAELNYQAEMEKIEEQQRETAAILSTAEDLFLKMAELNYQTEIKKTEQLQNEMNETFSTAQDIFKKMAELSYQAEMQKTEQLQQEMEQAQKNLANMANTVGSLGKGMANAGEDLFDAIMIVSTAASSVGTFTTGEFVPHPEGFQPITEEVWDGVMSFVAEDHVESTYKDFYANTTIGKWLDKKADGVFKSDGVVTQLASEVGHIGGIALTSVLTGGSPAILAGVAAFGRYTEEYWANARDASWEGIQDQYKKGEISEEEYQAISQIRNFNDEEWAYIELQHQQGTISDEDYEIYKGIREMPEEWTTAENRAMGTLYGSANAVWEGIQWQVGGSLDDLAVGSSKVINSLARIGIDTAFNAADTPFRALIDATTSDRTLKEAWDLQGGWTSLLMNVGVGLIGSTAGELKQLTPTAKLKATIDEILAFYELDPEFCKKFKEKLIQDVRDGVIKTENLQIRTQQELIKEFDMRHPNTLDTGSRIFQNATQIAEYFNDPYGFLASQPSNSINPALIQTKDAWRLIEENYDKLSVEDKNTFLRLFVNKTTFSQEQQELLFAFSRSNGPIYSAYSRHAEKMNFNGSILDGTSVDFLNNKLAYVNTVLGLNVEVDVRKNIAQLDSIIENSQPLAESIIVTRNIDDLFCDGDRLLILERGTQFNDRAMFSTSADSGNTFSERRIKLEIEVPAGEKVAYIQSAVANQKVEPYDNIYRKGMGYKQQEILLGRHNTYEIVDIPQFDENGILIIRAKIVQKEKSILSQIGADKLTDINAATTYYMNSRTKPSIAQTDLADLISQSKRNGIFAKYETEIRDLRNSGFYLESDRLPEHGVEHVEDVLFWALNIAENEGFNTRELELIAEAAKFHDCSREVTGINHGRLSAEECRYYLGNGFNEEDTSIIQAIIEYHAINDNEYALQGLFDKYNIPIEDRGSARKIAIALKDADALDRTRFPGNLDENYLRTDSAKGFVKASYQIQELRGTEFLTQNTFDEYTTETIDKLRKAGISDYEIAFWIKNAPDENGKAMGVWYNINDILLQILREQ